MTIVKLASTTMGDVWISPPNVVMVSQVKQKANYAPNLARLHLADGKTIDVQGSPADTVAALEAGWPGT